MNKIFMRFFASMVLITLSAITMQLFAENTSRHHLRGNIVNNETEAIGNAFVTLEGTVYSTVTDLDGNFILRNIPEGNYKLIVQVLGYQKKAIDVPVNEESTKDLNIILLESMYDMPQIVVLGNRHGLFDRVPGSVSVIDKMQIERISPVSGNEVFRNTPGVNVVDEEGVGLRVNIGIRGLDPGRSRSVLIMEDGIPVALKPYGEPEMYYTPAIERMEGVEIIKGSGSILFGPQTVGGVINYITADPPAESEGTVKLTGGEGGFFTGMLQYGNSFGNSGVSINYLRKQADAVGITSYRINDLNTKFRMDISEKSSLGLKIGVYDEVSNSTYVGMTTSMYESGDYDNVVLAPNDELEVRRYSLSATHQIKFNKNIRLRTTAFGYTTTRNWLRQDYSYTPVADMTGVIWGDTSVANGAIYLRDRTGNRNRQFEVAGIEPRLSVNYRLGSLGNELETGMRFLYERAFEQRINGPMGDVRSGDLRDDEIRTGYALSAYAQNRIIVNSKLSFTAGLRLENYEYERDILRTNFTDTTILAGSSTTSLIPGAGFSYRFTRLASLYGGVHRGFAPPRIKDAISSDGEAYQLDAEDSWNYELGIRSTPLNGLSFEVTGFFMDFNNQIIPVAEFAGGAGAGLINGGSTRHLGAEFGFSVDPGILANTNWSFLLRSSFTYVNAYYNEDRFVGTDGVNIKNNKTPYSPEILLYNALNITSPFGWYLYLQANYTGEQFADPLNTVEASANGRVGLIPSHLVLNASTGYKVEPWNTTFSLSVKNITDERYISTRRPQGIRVGLPRFITAGINFNF
ncbi:MAG: TonB-dependent receptor [Chitinophagaceae bacterium]|nr:MAG: TonB-dependent receptor [Chitinophagaceae bacterium]